MKKWFIILSIICAVGFISSAVLAGRVYYEDLKTYEDRDKKDLNKEAIQNVYIESAVPVEVQPTKGEAYVEFSQKFVDLVGIAPHYKLEVTEKGESTYIELNQISEILLWLGVKQDDARLTVYLPEGSMKSLSIVGPDYYGTSNKNQVINLEKININDLRIETGHADFNLNGSYGRVSLSAANGTLNMNSTSAAKLYTTGRMKQYLNGAFEKIVIKENNEEVNINSIQSAHVEIENNYSVNHLEGKYERIKLIGNHNQIDLRTDTECKLITEGYENEVYANGAFRTIDLDEVGSEIEIQTTMIPENIQMLGETSQTTLSLTLPSNIPGFMIKYVEYNTDQYDYQSDAPDYEMESYLGDEGRNIQSDFNPISKENKNGQHVYRYNDGSTLILVKREADIKLEVIDGGYSSSIEK